ncbi:hypothetical protein ACLOJK_008698 [Asimina triloba]
MTPIASHEYCSHLKNCMRQQRPVSAELSLLQGLTVLQESRSLRDPSMSPSIWNSHSATRRTKKPRRRSLGLEHQREVWRFLGDSLLVASRVTPDVAVTRSLGDIYDGRGSENVEDNRKNYKSIHSVGKKKLSAYGRNQDIARELVSREGGGNNEKISRGNCFRNLKTPSDRLREFLVEGDDVESSEFQQHEYLQRSKVHRSGGMMKTKASASSRDVRAKSEMPIASNSSVHGLGCENVNVQGGPEEYDKDKPEASQAPHSRCGILWNWSSFHHSGKTCMDMAGRSLSCGLPNSMLRRGKGHILQGQKAMAGMHVVSDHSSSSLMLDHDGLPLITDKLESHDHTAFQTHGSSGELDIFSDSNPVFSNNNFRHNQCSDLNSEGSSGSQCNSRKHDHGRHQSLVEKYMPKTFKDLVGQNLVVQALSNAIVQRRIGLLYAFYGPRGTGKTSCARIFAHALACQSLNDSKPCGICDSCIACELGKSQNVLEVNPVGNFNVESVIALLEHMDMFKLQSQYGAIIIDDCDALPVDSWTAISKVIDLAPQHVVFILVCTSLDHLPHTIISRSQKFCFQKLKDMDIIYTLQQLAENEGLEIGKDSMKLIASKSGGSLMDAEMTLDQLSLLGCKISLPLVQELVGLISNEKLVDLLDSALSADTVNTVKRLRGIMEAGVDPLELMSQLAALITDILAGSYVSTTEMQQRRFFQQPICEFKQLFFWSNTLFLEPPVSSFCDESMLYERLISQALKRLSEAEKQLRVSSDKLTWLAAALLQLAPDQQYILPGSSADVNFNQSTIVPNETSKRDVHKKHYSKQVKMPNYGRDLSTSRDLSNASGSGGFMHDNQVKRKKHVGVTTPQTLEPIPKAHDEVDEIWLAGKSKTSLSHLVNLVLSPVPSAELMFSSHANKCNAEKFRSYILQAFESVLGTMATIEMTCESRKDMKEITQVPFVSPSSGKLDSRLANLSERLSKETVGDQPGSTEARHLHSDCAETSKTEIDEIRPSTQECERSECVGDITQLEKKCSDSGLTEAPAASHRPAVVVPFSEERKIEEEPQTRTLVRKRVTLAQLLQQAEDCTQQNELVIYKGVSIAKKLETDKL